MRLIGSFLVIFSLSVQAQEITSPESLIAAAKKKYEGKWYRSVVFEQKTIEVQQDGTRNESTWQEQLQIPGLLNIRFEPLASGNGMLFARDSVFSFKDGSLVVARPLIHYLLLLGFDLYGQPVEQTMSKLKELKYDLSVIHEDTWNGTAAYVVGAQKGDDSTKQFWFDKEKLILLRAIEKHPRLGIVSEIQFRGYQKAEGGWIETEVVFLRGGKVVTEEHYSKIRTNVAIDPAAYDPLRWKEGMR